MIGGQKERELGGEGTKDCWRILSLCLSASSLSFAICASCCFCFLLLPKIFSSTMPFLCVDCVCALVVCLALLQHHIAQLNLACRLLPSTARHTTAAPWPARQGGACRGRGAPIGAQAARVSRLSPRDDSDLRRSTHGAELDAFERVVMLSTEPREADEDEGGSTFTVYRMRCFTKDERGACRGRGAPTGPQAARPGAPPSADRKRSLAARGVPSCGCSDCIEIPYYFNS